MLSTYFPTTELTWVRISPTYWSICAWKREENIHGRPSPVSLLKRSATLRNSPGSSHRPLAWWTWKPRLWRHTEQQLRLTAPQALTVGGNSLKIWNHAHECESQDLSSAHKDRVNRRSIGLNWHFPVWLDTLTVRKRIGKTKWGRNVLQVSNLRKWLTFWTLCHVFEENSWDKLSRNLPLDWMENERSSIQLKVICPPKNRLKREF